MAESTQVLVQQRIDKVLLLTLNRPQRHNAINSDVHRALVRAVAQADSDGCAVIVLTGAGDKAFCAGADMLELSGVSTSGSTVATQRDAARTQEAAERAPREDSASGYDALANTPLPVIAAINGYCYGGGALLAISCDIRLAVDTATFRLPGAEYGLVVGAAALPRLVGVSKAKEWIYTARKFDAVEAQAAGLVSSLYSADTLLPAALAMAQTIAGQSAAAVRASKRVMDAATLVLEARAMEAAANRELRGSAEQTQRFRAATRRVTGH